MTTLAKRLRQIKSNPKGVKYRELVSLLRRLGFEERGGRGSHTVFTHPAWSGILTLQNVKGEVKPYQVRQALKAIEEVAREEP